ncbi:YhcB family protein [Sciscionella sediminilitoris]|uniref:YhcB family protein n=1 Tax=Sciscionella sediminilitoris TaxID=1445613 RepID=UPI001E3A820D|nr:YhcB family protein [Sciscionella sp. SE31]
MNTLLLANRAVLVAADLEAKGVVSTIGKIAAWLVVILILIGLVAGVIIGYFIGRAVGRRSR